MILKLNFVFVPPNIISDNVTFLIPYDIVQSTLTQIFQLVVYSIIIISYDSMTSQGKVCCKITLKLSTTRLLRLHKIQKLITRPHPLESPLGPFFIVAAPSPLISLMS